MAPKPKESSGIDFGKLTPEQISKLTPTQKQEYLVWLGTQGTSSGSTGLPSNYMPGPRKWTDQSGEEQTYSGDQLINITTGATRPMYMIDQDPTAIIGDKLTKEGPQGLLKFLRNLKSLGFYEGGEVGNGSSTSDVSAVARLLRRSNIEGFQYDSLLTVARAQSGGIYSGGDGGAKTRVTSPTDLKNVFQTVSMSTLGRGLSESQINGMVQSYQQLEKQAAYGSTQAPNVQAYANENLRSKFKGEAQDFQAMNVADTMLDIIKGS
jgi:hypothetical protein